MALGVVIDFKYFQFFGKHKNVFNKYASAALQKFRLVLATTTIIPSPLLMRL